jgi:hypothetical protein
MACAFNPKLVEKMAKVIAKEAQALGVNQLFAPVVDLARELRFGRVEETFGEDAYLWVYSKPWPMCRYADHCQCRRAGISLCKGSAGRWRVGPSQAFCK